VEEEEKAEEEEVADFLLIFSPNIRRTINI